MWGRDRQEHASDPDSLIRWGWGQRSHHRPGGSDSPTSGALIFAPSFLSPATPSVSHSLSSTPQGVPDASLVSCIQVNNTGDPEKSQSPSAPPPPTAAAQE